MKINVSLKRLAAAFISATVCLFVLIEGSVVATESLSDKYLSELSDTSVSIEKYGTDYDFFLQKDKRLSTFLRRYRDTRIYLRYVGADGKVGVMSGVIKDNWPLENGFEYIVFKHENTTTTLQSSSVLVISSPFIRPNYVKLIDLDQLFNRKISIRYYDNHCPVIFSGKLTGFWSLQNGDSNLIIKNEIEKKSISIALSSVKDIVVEK